MIDQHIQGRSLFGRGDLRSHHIIDNSESFSFIDEQSVQLLGRLRMSFPGYFSEALCLLLRERKNRLKA
jgi:hypothetical protein